MELKGTRGLFDTAKSSRTCSVATVCLRLAFCPGLGAIAGEKWLFLAQTAQIWEGISQLGATAPGRHR